MLDYVATHGRALRNDLALVDLETDREWTWSAFDEAVNRVAHWLIERLGPRSGDRVATVGKNCAEMLILQFGCVRAGAIFVPLNWRLAPPEIAGLMADAAPALLFVHDTASDLEFEGAKFALGDLMGLVAEHSGEPPASHARQDWGAPSTLLYTSGTSGTPKGVMISEENAYWGSTNFIMGNGVSQHSVFLCDMPLFHTAGLFANARTPILAGGTLLVSQGFDPELTLSRLSAPKRGVTHYFSVPQMAQMLWNQPGFEPEKLKALEVFATGGAPNPSAQIERFVDAGIPMSDGFGMTETCSNFGMPVGDGDILKSKAGSIGLPYVALEARIVDDAGDDVLIGDVGELWLRGPTVTQGYWQQKGKTQEAFCDGWFKTGDAARCDDDGFYFLVDRKKDMFISGGENVYPAEVEASIAELSAVAECAVIGVPDARWGEVGLAYVVPVSGKPITSDEVLIHCHARLAKFKVPKSVVITDSIPRTGSGKALKHILRERAQSEG